MSCYINTRSNIGKHKDIRMLIDGMKGIASFIKGVVINVRSRAVNLLNSL